jgi:RNA-binding protein
MPSLTPKKRASLKSEAQTAEPLVHVGKNGIGTELITSVSNAFNTREVLKCRVLESAPESAQEIAPKVAEATGSEVVQVIGNVFVLYKKMPDKKLKEKRKKHETKK